MDLSVSWSHIIAIATFVVGGWIAVRNSMQGQLNRINVSVARIETKVDDLSEDVRRHNGVVERTAIMERDQKAVWRNIESNRNDINAVRDEMHRLHSHAHQE